MTKPIWNIDWDKVESLDDIKNILKSLRLGFKGDLNEFPLIQDKLTLYYGDDND